MQRASRVTSWGANFGVCSVARTMLESSLPVIAVAAVRTGAGKSQTTRFLARLLKDLGKRVVAVRHPMPYGDLATQACQRFATYGDLEKYDCTIEEREEYQPHIDNGFVAERPPKAAPEVDPQLTFLARRHFHAAQPDPRHDALMRTHGDPR